MTAAHLDLKRDLGEWLVWCSLRRAWARVLEGCCAGCGADVRDRFKDAA